MSEIRECPLTLKVWIYFVQSQNKLLPDSTLMSKNQKALALNPFQDEEPISLIGSIKYNWYNNILSLGSKNYQRKLWHFFFLCSSFFFFLEGGEGVLMTPAILFNPDSFAAQEEEMLHGTIWEDGFSLKQLLQVAPKESLKTCRPQLALQTSHTSPRVFLFWILTSEHFFLSPLFFFYFLK